MRRAAVWAVAALVLGAAGVWAVGRPAPGAATAAPAPPAVPGAVLTLAVPSMTCGSCEGRISRALEARPGVGEVRVDLGARVVRVAYDPALADPKALAEAVTAAGYPARYLAPGAPLPAPARGGGGCGGGCCDNRS